MRINGMALTGGERGVYGTADTRARRKYLRDHGSPALQGDVTAAEVREHGARWRAEHGAAYDAAGERAGTSAVKRMLSRHAANGHAPSAARLAELGLTGRTRRTAAAVAPAAVPAAPVPADVANVPETAPERVRKTSKLNTCDRHAGQWAAMAPADRFRNACEGGNGDSECAGGVCVLIPGTDRYTRELAAGGPVELAVLNGRASQLPDHLTLTARGHVAPRPGIEPLAADRPEPVTVSDIAAASGGRVVILPVTAPAPETVPDALPAMTRAARKASNRETAAALRSFGLDPRGAVWDLATAGGVSPAELAGMAADDIVTAAAQLATVTGGAL